MISGTIMKTSHVSGQELPLSAYEMEVWRSFRSAHARLTRRLEAELVAGHALSLASYDMLVQLVEAPDRRLRMTELAERVLISRSGLTRLVDRLHHQGLVQREVCATDARGFFAVLTTDGYAQLQTASGTHLRGVQVHAVARFSPSELRQFGELLALLAPDGRTVA